MRRDLLSSSLPGVEAELDRLVRRLRHLPSGQWPARRPVVLTLLRRLAGGRVVPDLPDFALPDAVAVVGWEAIALARAAGPEERAAVKAVLEAALRDLR